MYARGGNTGPARVLMRPECGVGWEIVKYDECYNKIEKPETHLSKDLFFRDHFFLGSKIKNTEIVTK